MSADPRGPQQMQDHDPSPAPRIAGRLAAMSSNPTPLSADSGRRGGRPPYAYGGQALMEGVLMRGRDAIAVALRHPDGRIVTATEGLKSGVHGSPASKWPFVRGLVVLYETLVIGTRWLVRSANVQAQEDDVELGKGSVAAMLLITFGVAIAVFSLLPLFISSVATAGSSQRWAQPAVEGVIQVGIFLGYLTLVSRAPDIYRVFQYHGAEHMTIHALEAGDPLTVDEVRKYPTAHHRCGTEFLVILVLLSIFTFSLVGRQAAAGHDRQPSAADPGPGRGRLRGPADRRPLPPVPVVRAIMFPGILVQMITTKRPTDDMIEVAITSMEEALVADGNAVPAGSTLFEREPLELPSKGDTAHRSDGRRQRGQPGASRQPHHERARREARRDRRPIRRPPGQPGHARGQRRPERVRRLGRELARLQPTVEAFRRLQATREELAGARELRDAGDGDEEMRSMARDEIARLEADETRLVEELGSSCSRGIRMTIAT